MKRKRDRSRGILAEASVDYGPSFRLNKAGKLVTWGGAATVDVASRDDPTDPARPRTVRGAKRRHALFELHQHRVIDAAMFHAAQDFLDDCSIACGTGSSGEIGGFGGTAGPRSGLPERQTNAITRINEVRNVLGLNEGTIFWHVVFDNGSIRDYEIRHRLQFGTATQMLRDALNALDRHYHRRVIRNNA